MEFVISWLDRIFDVKGRQNLALTWEIVRDIVVIGSLDLALRLSGSPVVSVGVYVGLDFLCSVAWLLLAFKIAGFAVEKLWQIGAMFLGVGCVALAMLGIIHLGFQVWEAFFCSSLLMIATEGYIFLKLSRGSRLL
jgi:hypothetical protein